MNKSSDLRLQIVVDRLSQLSWQAQFWSRDRITHEARELRNKLQEMINETQKRPIQNEKTEN